jgi:hypothetical protein
MFGICACSAHWTYQSSVTVTAGLKFPPCLGFVHAVHTGPTNDQLLSPPGCDFHHVRNLYMQCTLDLPMFGCRSRLKNWRSDGAAIALDHGLARRRTKGRVSESDGHRSHGTMPIACTMDCKFTVTQITNASTVYYVTNWCNCHLSIQATIFSEGGFVPISERLSPFCSSWNFWIVPDLAWDAGRHAT